MLKAFFVAASEYDPDRAPLNSPTALLTRNPKQEPQPEEDMEPVAVNYYKVNVLFGSAWKSGHLSQGVEAMFDPARTANSVQSSPKIPPYPSRVPESKAELERVICLLGNRTKTELNLKAHEELVALLGTYATLKEASVWKQYLKAVLKQKLQAEG